jgi:large subunit ribosomal protein L29
MKASELRQKSKVELAKILQDNREKLQQLRFDLSAGKVKNVREIRQMRKDIARILTLLKIELPFLEAKVKMRTKSSSPLKK